MGWTTPPTYAPGFANRMTSAIANAQLRDNMNYLYRSYARKTGNTSVTSSTAFIDDPHLLLPLLANEVFAFEGFLLYTGLTAGDLKLAFTVPASATGGWGVLGADDVTTTNVEVSAFTAFGDANFVQVGALGSGTFAGVFIQGTVVNSTTPGNLQLRWAQAASSGTSTTINANSYLIGYRLAP